MTGVHVRLSAGLLSADRPGWRRFLTENGLISLAGALAGVVLAFALNAWMMRAFETSRLSLLYVGSGVLILLLLGQLAVLSPARRASRVPPVEATRTI